MVFYHQVTRTHTTLQQKQTDQDLQLHWPRNSAHSANSQPQEHEFSWFLSISSKIQRKVLEFRLQDPRGKEDPCSLNLEAEHETFGRKRRYLLLVIKKSSFSASMINLGGCTFTFFYITYDVYDYISYIIVIPLFEYSFQSASFMKQPFEAKWFRSVTPNFTPIGWLSDS